jgi:hypothetical protein
MFILIACYLSILISGISYARIAEKALFESKTSKLLYRVVLVLITVIVTFLTFQFDRNIYPGFRQGDKTYHVHILKQNTFVASDLDQGRRRV